MIYRASVLTRMGNYSKEFATIQQAAEWLDSENNNGEHTTMIETFDEKGRKEDGFFYTTSAK